MNHKSVWYTNAYGSYAEFCSSKMYSKSQEIFGIPGSLQRITRNEVPLYVNNVKLNSHWSKEKISREAKVYGEFGAKVGM